jgi:hypothetical protein
MNFECSFGFIPRSGCYNEMKGIWVCRNGVNPRGVWGLPLPPSSNLFHGRRPSSLISLSAAADFSYEPTYWKVHHRPLGEPILLLPPWRQRHQPVVPPRSLPTPSHYPPPQHSTETDGTTKSLLSQYVSLIHPRWRSSPLSSSTIICTTHVTLGTKKRFSWTSQVHDATHF